MRGIHICLIVFICHSFIAETRSQLFLTMEQQQLLRWWVAFEIADRHINIPNVYGTEEGKAIFNQHIYAR